MKYKVYANNQLIGEIADKAKLEVNLNPGMYCVSAKALWFKGKEQKMDLKKGDKLSIKSNKYLLWLPIIPSIIYGIIVLFESNPQYVLYSYFIVMLFLFIILNLPVVRKNYFIIMKE